eukprot:CAMPEP_0172157146 /NCGR_PEP_ID=MMETSP1050-20130122/3620_1 /TAXON_ID=233186 /ORGANISM="Cryptomonas curvata, Strain CCAP979/52" /LENGTH=335 /DNA_ID=CAMNT_0012826325 /DNA_START=56 /DNA_END=1060 /DNA_ORIENTATION=+
MTCTPNSSVSELFRECARLADMNGQLCVKHNSIANTASAMIRELAETNDVHTQLQNRFDMMSDVPLLCDDERTIRQLKDRILELEKSGPVTAREVGPAAPADENSALRARIAELEAEMASTITQYETALDDAKENIRELMSLITEQPTLDVDPFEGQCETITANILQTVESVDALLHRVSATESKHSADRLEIKQKMAELELVAARIRNVPVKKTLVDTPFMQALNSIGDLPKRKEFSQGIYKEINFALLHLNMECCSFADFEQKVLPNIQLRIKKFDKKLLQSAKKGGTAVSDACFQCDLNIAEQYAAMVGTKVDPDVPENRRAFMKFFVKRVL